MTARQTKNKGLAAVGSESFNFHAKTKSFPQWEAFKCHEDLTYCFFLTAGVFAVAIAACVQLTPG